MSVEDAKKKLARAGYLCEGCHDFWKSQNLQPKYLVHVFNEDGEIITTEGGIEVVICPHCDGDYILDLKKIEG